MQYVKVKASSVLLFLKRNCHVVFCFDAPSKAVNFSSVRPRPLNTLHSFVSVTRVRGLMSIQNTFLRYLSFKCHVKREPHSIYIGVYGFIRYWYSTEHYVEGMPKNLVFLYLNSLSLTLIVHLFSCVYDLKRLWSKCELKIRST